MTTKTSFQQVAEFHQVFGHPWYQKGRIPNVDAKRVQLRLRLIFEELEELCDALFVNSPSVETKSENEFEESDVISHDGMFLEGFKSLFTLIEEHIGQMTQEDLDFNIVEIADALGDIIYVVNGTAHTFNIELDAVTTEIHRSNMSKLGEDGKPIYRANDHKVVKGPNYTPPNIQEVFNNT